MGQQLGHSLQFISSEASSQSMNWLQRLEFPMQLPSRQRNSVAAQLVSARGKPPQRMRLGCRTQHVQPAHGPHSRSGRACMHIHLLPSTAMDRLILHSQLWSPPG